MTMLDHRPYLFFAIYDWVVESECTPIVVVSLKDPDLVLPPEWLEGVEPDTQIALRVSESYILGIESDEAGIYLETRISGRAVEAFLPMDSLLLIYAEESGRGMHLQGGDFERPKKRKKPSLSLVVSNPERKKKKPRRHLELVKENPLTIVR